jgi:hypothetical protein
MCTAGVPNFIFTMKGLTETMQIAPGLGPGDVIPYQAIVNCYQDVAVAGQSDSNIASILQKYGIAVYASDGTAIVPPPH